MIYAFTIICALIPGSTDSQCKVDAYKTNIEYTDTSVCAKDFEKNLAGSPEQYEKKILNPKEGQIFYNYGCVNYPTDPIEDMDLFAARINKLYGPSAVKEDA